MSAREGLVFFLPYFFFHVCLIHWSGVQLQIALGVRQLLRQMNSNFKGPISCYFTLSKSTTATDTGKNPLS